MVTKWRILERPIIAKLETIEKMICALVCLHNFLKKSDLNKNSDSAKYCPSTYMDRETESGDLIEGEWRTILPNGLNSVRRMGGNAYSRGASSMRSILAEYFMNIAPIQAQWSK
ncbi:hypothetical protein NQ314_019251 [Rhamnusium bicolor]|uniref:DDE Tnp4 domain-containing protein n=1 Tax=Rhamnusium bicolor TaxID=1586634 RepID=A0AAV8WPB7_9CUCU|nr:hypothetical protein NQ314_019251 [Rhamnusium bicolor]